MSKQETIDYRQTLNYNELYQILTDLHRKRRAKNTRQNRVIFRLATCCGLRTSEIRSLTLGDVRINCKPPHIRIRPEISKRNKGRTVPLNLDAGTLRDIGEWKWYRGQEMGAGNDDPFICCVNHGLRLGVVRYGQSLGARTLEERFKSSIRVLGPKRVKQLSIRNGRHTFLRIALQTLSPPRVAEMTGISLKAASRYFSPHIPRDPNAVGELFKPLLI